MENKQSLKEQTPHGTVSFPFASYRWNGENRLDVTLHWHNEAEIIFLHEGAFEMNVNMQTYRVEAPAMLFLMPEEIHSLRLVRGLLESAFVFDLKMLSFENFDAVQYKIIHPLIENQIQFPRLVQANSPVWNQLAAAYLHALYASEKEGIGACLQVKAGLYQMIACLYEQNCFQQESRPKKNDTYQIETIKKVLTFLRGSYSQKITVEDAAKIAGMNPQYFCRYFRKMTGCTLTAYLNTIRVEHAKQLLLETDSKVIDIAACCGYENIGYFIKRFQDMAGMPPSAFRKQAKRSK